MMSQKKAGYPYALSQVAVFNLLRLLLEEKKGHQI
jgi:hypothetical protein